jgi:hypothetical protein
MKNLLQKFTPRPRPEFAQQLEQKLLARGSWREKSFNLRSMKRLSLIYGSGLLLVAVATGLLYPFGPTDDYIAQAKEYYESYEPDGIFYQKKQIYSVHPKGYDMDTIYTVETWDYERNNLYITEKINGDLYDAYKDKSMMITDEAGNIYSYGDPSMYATNSNPVHEEPYCVLTLVHETEDQKTVSNQAFEASPNALEVYNNIYLPKDFSHSFISLGEVSDYMYTGNSSYSSFLKKFQLDEEVQEAEMAYFDLYSALIEAEYAPEQAKLFFDFLSQREDYTHETRINDQGEEEHVFRLPAFEHSYTEETNGRDEDDEVIEKFRISITDEFVFDDQYGLLEHNTYHDGELQEQVKYLETKILPVAEKDAIFNPETYGLELTMFEHPLWEDSFLKEEEGLTCYSFQNELLSDEETQQLGEDYAVLIENIKSFWEEEAAYFEEDF